jgi:hypothetical protein
MIKKPKQTFTVPERERIMNVLSENDGHYGKTIDALAKEGIKVSRVSLRKWNNDPKYLINPVPKQIPKTIKEISDLPPISEDELKQDILTRMQYLIPKERNLNSLANALRTIHDLTKNSPPPNTGLSLIQTVYQTIIEKSNETSKNRIQGNIQDVTPIDESKRAIEGPDQSQAV